ncbi:MAG: hypothetical protein LBD37_04645 [Treponema sp.]|jgi:hypothetical protein|nr:hypothetical protein [Treponema sp.]
MGKRLFLEKGGFAGQDPAKPKSRFKINAVLQAALFFPVFCLGAAFSAWPHPHSNPADERGESRSLEVLGGEVSIGGYLKTRLMIETDTRKKEDGAESPTSVFFDTRRSAAPAPEDGGFPVVQHAGHGGSAPSAGGSGAEDDFDDGTSLRAELSAVFSRKEGGMKLTFRKNMGPLILGVDGEGEAVEDESVNFLDTINAYGWFNVWNNVFTITAGIIGDGIFGTSALEHTATDTSYDEVRGIRVAVTPFKIPGLLFGLSWDAGTYLGSSLYGGSFGANFGSGAYVAEADQPRFFDSLASFFSQTRFGALYIHETLGGLSLSVKPKGFFYDGVITPGNAFGHGFDLLFGIQAAVLSRYDFLFILEGEFRNIGIDQELVKAAAPLVAGTASAGEAEKRYAASCMPGFDLYFTAINEYFYDTRLGARYRLHSLNKVGDTVYDEECSFVYHEVRLFGSYQMRPKVAAGLEVQFDIDGVTLHEELNHKTPDRDSVFKGCYLQPGLTFTIGKGLSIVIQDKLYLYNERYIANPYPDGGYLLNQVKLDFIWSF